MDDVIRIDNHPGLKQHGPSATQALPFQQRDATRMRMASETHERGVRGTPYTTISYYNYTERDVVFTSRDGTALVVPPIGNGRGDEIIVCVTRTMPRATMERTLDNLNNRPNVEDRETHYWSRAYAGALRNTSIQVLSASVEYVLYWKDMIDAGGRCYMPDVDLLVEWLGDRGAIHPFDKVKRDEATLASIAPGLGEATMAFMIKAIDNGQQTTRGTRYINIGGDVYMIPIERDLRYATGVHVVCRKPSDGGRVSSSTIERTYSFEEADKKFTLHRTIEDAINGGPLNDMAKGLLERDVTLRRLEEARIRTEQLEAERDIQKLRNEGAHSKAKQDKEATIRRNYVEWAKTIVAIVGAAITLYGVVSKLTAKS